MTLPQASKGKEPNFVASTILPNVKGHCFHFGTVTANLIS